MHRAIATRIKVRVQALGGKFLGDDIGGAVVTIRDSQTGELLATGRTQGDSGNLSTTYSSDASPSVLVTPSDDGLTPPRPPAVLRWLTPDAGSSHFTTDLSLDRPRLLEISAFGPLGGLQTAHRVSVTEWFVPDQNVDGPLGLVLVLPGLLVQVMQPATHTAFASSTAQQTIHFEANVAMMCGCPINNTPNNPWVPTDFDVYADIRPLNVPAAAVTRLPLAFNRNGKPSLFCGEFQFTPGTGPVFYEAVVTARQKTTSNTGTGTVTFFVQPPATT